MLTKAIPILGLLLAGPAYAGGLVQEPVVFCETAMHERYLGTNDCGSGDSAISEAEFNSTGLSSHKRVHHREPVTDAYAIAILMCAGDRCSLMRMAPGTFASYEDCSRALSTPATQMIASQAVSEHRQKGHVSADLLCVN